MTRRTRWTDLDWRAARRPCLAAIASAALTATSAASPDPDVVLRPVAPHDPKGLSVGLFAADSTLKAPVETLKPLQSTAVTALKVSLNNNPGLCPDHTVTQILELPNQEPGGPPADGPECIFGALLGIETATRSYEVATECGEWVDNVATCWGYGQTGEFRLHRNAAKSPSAFRLVFPGSAALPGKTAERSPSDEDAGATPDPTGQKHGLFLDTPIDEQKRVRGDLWLVWAGGTVEIAYMR